MSVKRALVAASTLSSDAWDAWNAPVELDYLEDMTDWEARYAEAGYAFGTKPNDFLRENVQHLPKGRILCLAEGEGRNAVWLAQRGYTVTAVQSPMIEGR